MAFNPNMLKAKIAEHGLRSYELAEIIGINKATLYKKMHGKGEFNRREMSEIRKALNLSAVDMDSIFFS